MKLEKLTPEQEKLMYTIRDKWINQLYDLKPINKPQLLEGIKWLYNFCKMETPKVIICESILEAQITLHILKNNVWANVRANVRDNVGANVWDNVWANVGDNVGDIKVEPMCYYGDINDYSWAAFHDFFTQIGVNKNEDFNSFVKLLLSNYYSMIQMRNLCVVIKLPKHILLNEQKQLNSTNDYAIKFNDGTGMYFVNGFYMSDSLFNRLKKNEYSFEDFIKEDNEEVKSAVISFYQQEFGEEHLFRFLSKNLKEVDTFTHIKEAKYLEGTTRGQNIGVYTLFKGSINNLEIAYVRCYCPSTDRMFFLGVEPTNDNAKDAIASLYKCPAALINEIESINRQGEIYSTTFTTKGEQLLEALTKEDVANQISVSGDVYFDKLKYEY